VKQVKNPRILHVATHGFFLPNKPRTEGANEPSKSFRSTLPLSNQENALLRSGLILAGVKQQHSGEGEDGVLTALEMAGLNLWGTKLVVLSACETGLGDVKRGEGLYGLRRALVLAGSESQLISLWKVSDAGTRDLMTAYYTRIQNHQGRTEALREVQMAMLGGKLTSSTALLSGQRETTDVGEKNVAKNYRHPYYWAAFIQSGDWRNMEGR
jgi:CHAT domain-containing protein